MILFLFFKFEWGAKLLDAQKTLVVSLLVPYLKHLA
jgi:hypothetical protein